MRITIARHGEIDNRFLGKYNGHNDISLSTKGESQAIALAEYFKESNFDAYFCSDLLRAKQTIAPFNKEVIYSSKLREKSWGVHEGMSFDEICLRDALKYENFEQWISTLDGENYLKFIERVKKFFFEELKVYKYENIFIMTHSGVIKTLIHLLEDISLEEAFGKKIAYTSFISYDTKNIKPFS